MPEGPDVKNLSIQLNKVMKRNILHEVNVLSGKYKRINLVGLSRLKKELPLKLIKINSKGKFIWFQFDNNVYLFCGLGMVGEFVFDDVKHNRVEFVFDKKTLFFNDYRNFGNLKFVFGRDKLEQKLNELGPSFLSDNITRRQFVSVLRKYDKKTLRDVLMNQKIFSGIGNYIFADVMYLAKLHPLKKIGERDDAELENLLKVIKKYVKKTFENKQKYGEKKGYYDFVIYNQLNDSYGNKVLRIKDKNKRTIHYVKEVQKN